MRAVEGLAGIERENWWREHLERRRQLKWSRVRYCQTNNLSVHKLTYWERKLTEQLDKAPAGAPMRFLPVRVAGRLEPPAPRSGGAIRLRVGPARIEVRAGFDPAVLRELVRALGGR